MGCPGVKRVCLVSDGYLHIWIGYKELERERERERERETQRERQQVPCHKASFGLRIYFNQFFNPLLCHESILRRNQNRHSNIQRIRKIIIHNKHLSISQ